MEKYFIISPIRFFPPTPLLCVIVSILVDKPLICIVVHSRGCEVLFSKFRLSIIFPVLDIKAYKHHYVQKKDKNTIVRIVHGDAYIMKSSANGRPRGIFVYKRDVMI